MTSKTVAIIGAGASGLVAAKVLLTDGFNITVFDRYSKLGGIWSEDGSYFNLHSQQISGTMEYSDFPDTNGKYSFYFLFFYINSR